MVIKIMTKKLFLSICILLITVSSFSQESKWGLGLTGGFNSNKVELNKGIATDYRYPNRFGYNVGIVGRYRFVDWFALRADLRVSSRNYRMERETEMVNNVYTNYRNTFLQLPIVADFSFGGKKLRGHFYAGGYIGGWLDAHRSGVTYGVSLETEDKLLYFADFDEKMEFDSRRDQRFNAGLTCGVGINYLFHKHWEVMLESFYQYDLTNSNKSTLIATPRYNNTLSCSVGLLYNL